tara:strand:+ start:17273 stop:17902 length:630 start_codon:yes stop_codon:yes gene_type:complete
MGAPGYQDGFRTVTLMPERLEQPYRRRKSTVYFVNSMSDLFQEAVPFGFIDEVMAVIDATPRHTYQILTKRAGRMAQYFATRSVPDNAWLGVSVEDRRYGLPRIPHLQRIAAKTRFLSVEPLLEDIGEMDLAGISWVIVGGESGSKARPMKTAWAQSVRRQCERDDVDFFFKQWGAWGPDGVKRSKKQNGRELDGAIWDAMPNLIAVAS